MRLHKASAGRISILGVVVGVALLALGWTPAQAQKVHTNKFEAPQPCWVKGGTDASFEETVHAISDQGALDGQRCEFIQLQIKAGAGSFIHYHYPVAKAPLSDELSAGLWLKSNRPGIQLAARVVLPNERDPNNLDSRLTTFIRDDPRASGPGTYRNTGRWQRLELARPAKLAKDQQQLLQAQLKRPVDFTNAYVDALVLNVYAGPGPTEVWIDDLEIGPVFGDPAPPAERTNPLIGDPKVGGAKSRRGQIVEFNGAQLVAGGKRVFFRGIQHTDTPMRTLRDAGFNTVFLGPTSSREHIQEAAELGMWLAPQVQALGDGGQLGAAESVAQEMSRYLESDAVLFWRLGRTLTTEQLPSLTRAAQMVRQGDPGRPLAADVWDGMLPYSRLFNLVGVHRWPLMTTLELSSYRDWLEQRRRLANPGAFLWTFVQTHMHEGHTQLLYGRSSAAGFDEPIGPQPEHIRLLTYTALASGCKGLGFWSDRFLADSHQGRDRLLCCALLNQEMDMLEPLLVSLDEAPQWIETSSPDVKAAVLRTGKSVLVLPLWLGKGAQFVPGQAAVSKLSMVVPQVPQSMQAVEVTPADVRGLRAERVVGGTKVTLPEFGMTAAVVFTADTNVIVRMQEQARHRRQNAAQWTYDMAVYEMDKVLKVHQALERMGKTQPDAAHLVSDAQTRLRSAKEMWDSRLFAESYREAERALRPLRILMRAQWEAAVKGLDSPVSSPYALSYFTLPQHWQFMAEIAQPKQPNVLPGGDFETVPERTQEGWRVEEPTLDQVEMLAQRVGGVQTPLSKGAASVPSSSEQPYEGKQCVMLQIRPKGKGPTPQALERTLLALNSPSVRLQPGTLVQVSGWVRIPYAIQASPDGALLYDSVGGEPLAIRLTQPTPWKKFTVYRRIPASGTINVSLALTGLGTVYFDDVRVEPLTTGGPVVDALPTSGRK